MEWSKHVQTKWPEQGLPPVMFYMNAWYPAITWEGQSKALECLLLGSSGGLCMNWAPHHTALIASSVEMLWRKLWAPQLPMTYQWPHGTWLQSQSSEGIDTLSSSQEGILCLVVLDLNCLIQFPHNKSSRPTVSPFFMGRTQEMAVPIIFHLLLFPRCHPK